MALVDQKKDIFGKIAALRTLNDGYPEFKLNPSFPSINNNSNSLDFLLDLLKSLVGFEELRSVLVNTIVYELDNIEVEIKKTLKKELKGFLSCGINPSIPDFILNQNSGVQIKAEQVDFLNILKIEPNSDVGKLLYDDVNGGLTSTDFNTFLFNVMQNEGTEYDWGNNTGFDDILSVKFDSVGTTVNNVLTLKASTYYSNPNNNKTLTDLNNDYIDSLTLFGSGKMINNMIDMLFGSISFTVNKSKEQLEMESKIEDVINCIINSDSTDVIDDSFFQFSNEELLFQQQTAENKRRGIRKLVTCDDFQSTVPIDDVATLNTEINNATNQSELFSTINNGVDTLADLSAQDAPDADKYNIKLNFIDEMLRKLTMAIVNVIISPKLVSIFVINYKIVYGESDTFVDPIDFLRKNKSLFTSIVKKVRDIIIKILLKEVLKAITGLIASNTVGRVAEFTKNKQTQFLSLFGVPTDVIRLINQLT